MTFLPFWLRRHLVLNALRSDLEKIRLAIWKCNNQLVALTPFVSNTPTGKHIAGLVELFKFKKEEYNGYRIDTLEKIQAWEGFESKKDWHKYEEQKVLMKYEVSMAQIDSFLQETRNLFKELETGPPLDVDATLDQIERQLRDK